jgi:cell division protein FtsL
MQKRLDMFTRKKSNEELNHKAKLERQATKIKGKLLRMYTLRAGLVDKALFLFFIAVIRNVSNIWA